MSNIVIAFPKNEEINYIEKILAQSGYPASIVATTGEKALAGMRQLQEGIVICGNRLVDMTYSDLHEQMPEHFKMLLVSSESQCQRELDKVTSLYMPIKVHELLSAVETMTEIKSKAKSHMGNRCRKRSREEQEMLEKAKNALMESYGFSEEEAHRYIQRSSMNERTSLIETARGIIGTFT